MIDSFYSWFKNRRRHIAKRDTRVWLFLCAGLWVSSTAVAIVTGIGNPTGIGLLFDVWIHFFLHQVAFGTVVLCIAWVASLVYLPVPRLFLGSSLYTGGLVYFTLVTVNLSPWFALMISMIMIATGVILGYIGAVLSSSDVNPKVKVLVSLCVFSVGFGSLFWLDVDQRVVSSFDFQGEVGESLADNPAKPGAYAVSSFTYGSGRDQHRHEFGSAVDLQSKSIDASSYIEKWPWPRTLFWGFNQEELPINGRVWMPEGEGPFPLVIMAHGNHRMEKFSDEGYGYLGEHLASRGFITVSADHNFLNYSAWSGIPEQDMKLRAWIFMQHLLQIEQYNDQPGTHFHQKVDLSNIALVGHSRGGQAAAMVADYMQWFADDESLAGMNDLRIQAVIGLAPTDQLIDNKRATLNNTYYLVLHGARDADVNNFRGDRQYMRTLFDEDSERFKSSVYLAEANHSQFNTDWGRLDISLPGGLFLNQRETMDAIDQREIALVYVSAFLETALHHRNDYVDLFRDFRYGEPWLPDTQYVNRFESGLFVPLKDFDRAEGNQNFDEDVSVKASGFTEWELDQVEDRGGNNRGYKGVVLEWEKEAVYSTIISEQDDLDEQINDADHLILSLANLETKLPKTDDIASTMEMEVELVSNEGIRARLPLDQFMQPVPPIQTQYAWISWFDSMMREKKFAQPFEPVFQTYALALATFEKNTTGFSKSDLAEIHLHVTGGPGKVMLDEMGFE